MRLDKPIGSLLLLWPTWWALWVAARGFPGWKNLVVFTLGVVVMRSAGCVINDIADQKFDRQVWRTKKRPLAAGEMSLRSAWILFILLDFIGLILVLQLNARTVALSVIALLLAILYPFTKRITYLPQLFLGAAFAWSVPMAFMAVNGYLPAISGLLFMIAVLWPIAYDTIYALMDKEDDLKVGIKSTAILFKQYNMQMIFAIQLLVLIGLITLGKILHFNVYFFIAVIVALGLSLYQMKLISRQGIKDYYQAFYNNHWFGLVIFIGLLIQGWA